MSVAASGSSAKQVMTYGGHCRPGRQWPFALMRVGCQPQLLVQSKS